MKLPEKTPPPATSRQVTLQVGGRSRVFLLHKPASPSLQSDPALIVALHGGGGTAGLMEFATGWSDLADRHGLFVAYPEAVPLHPNEPPTFLRNPQMWNVGSGIGHAEQQGIDDVAFLGALLDWCESSLSIRRGAALVTGFSMSGSLAYRCAAELPGRFACAAPVSGHWWRPHDGSISGCSLLTIAGDADPINPLHGGATISPWGDPMQAPPIRASVERWANAVSAAGAAKVSRLENLTREEFPAGRQGERVALLTVKGMGHVWPGGRSVLVERLAGPSVQSPDATAVIAAFSTRCEKPDRLPFDQFGEPDAFDCRRRSLPGIPCHPAESAEFQAGRIATGPCGGGESARGAGPGAGRQRLGLDRPGARRRQSAGHDEKLSPVRR